MPITGLSLLYIRRAYHAIDTQTACSPTMAHVTSVWLYVVVVISSHLVEPIAFDRRSSEHPAKATPLAAAVTLRYRQIVARDQLLAGYWLFALSLMRPVIAAEPGRSHDTLPLGCSVLSSVMG